MTTIEPTFTPLFADHAAAVREFIDVASGIPAKRWDEPRAPGKWSPAQETKHVTLGYVAFMRDLRGESSMRLRGRWWQRLVWRWLVLPRIFSERRIPGAAPAPREVRPSEQPGDQVTLLAELADTATHFETALRESLRDQPERRVTHPYFNRLRLEEVLRLCAIHTRHHAAFLRTSPSDVLPRDTTKRGANLVGP